MSENTHKSPFPAALAESVLVGNAIFWMPDTTSTNAHALESDREGAVFIAEHQTCGRGRHGKQWHSAPGLGLWFSVALEAPLPGISFGAALAIRQALSKHVSVDIQWPNDVYLADRKIGGILVEQRGTRIALGIGINVNHEPRDFPPYLRHRAGSLAMLTGQTWDRQALLSQILLQLDCLVQRLRGGETAEIHADWAAACGIVGKKIRRGRIVGLVTSIEADGALLVSTASGLKRISCGDVSIVRVT